MLNTIKKLFFLISCLILQANAMEIIFLPLPNISQDEREIMYQELDNYLNSFEGKICALYPPNGKFAFPSRHTYALHLAIALSDEDHVDNLLQCYGSKIIANSNYGCRTLNFALQCGHLGIVQMLMHNGAKTIKLTNGKHEFIEMPRTIEELKKIADKIQNKDAEEMFDDPYSWN